MEALLEYIKAANPGQSTEARIIWFQALINGIHEINNIEKGKLDRQELAELMAARNEPNFLQEHSKRMLEKFARYGQV